MWKVVNLAAISVSADLLDLWFLGDLLGIFCVSVEFVFFFGVSVEFVFFFGADVFLSLSWLFGISSVSVFISLGVLDGMRYCG